MKLKTRLIISFITVMILPVILSLAFILTNVDDSLPEVRQFMVDMVFMVVMILALAVALLIIWIYRGIAKPLGRMKIATQNIKDGNLDFELEVETDDEIGQLCRDFEEMRIRLKESSSRWNMTREVKN